MLAVSFRAGFLLLLFSLSVFGQSVPAPADVIGFTPGDDRKLASWAQIVDYFKKLDAASNKVQFYDIGKTTMDKPFVYAAISSPENLRNLEKYKDINAKLADPRLIKSKDKTAQALMAQGKTIVMITCGIHSTEVGSTLSSMLIAHRLVTSNEPEVQNILKNTIVLLVPSLNPDGVDIVKNWYDKTLGTKYEGTEPPELYHKYIGHDNNRDWYAFTQVETQLTVDKIHNVWHPQIVHDIHQQGATGARLFIPPYMAPVEPNVPKELVEGYTELGNFIASDLRQKGFQGITTNSTYDAWTPARAYSHYHGGVRILSETASARLATPVNIKSEQLRSGLGYDVRVHSANFGPVWLGGDWKLRNITDYMTGTAFSLMTHAADKRAQWLSRFYAIGKEAVRPRKKGELFGIVIPHPIISRLGPSFHAKTDDYGYRKPRWVLLDILERAGVEVKETNKGYLVRMDQPYASFAKALLEKQEYPNLVDSAGQPIPPYDVTAHTLTLLHGVSMKPVYAPFDYQRSYYDYSSAGPASCSVKANLFLYRSSIASMDEGWTRWILDQRKKCVNYDSLRDADIKTINKVSSHKTIVFPDQSPNQMLNGYRDGQMPEEYTGGIGKDGVKNLKKFVEDGGTLIFFNKASDFAIEHFDLPVKDVTDGLPRKDFYIPGSILRTEVDTKHKIAKDMPAESIAWFEHSPAFEVLPSKDGAQNVEIIARYPSDPAKILLSGWALGAEKLAGKAALVSVNIGKGKIVLFGFRPQYRGQSLATFPLIFNALAN